VDSNLRKGWTQIVTGEDLDKHLAMVGQAQVNARLLVELLAASSLRADAELLLADVGTGQLFDYADIDVLARYRLTCTDINANFLAALETRLRATPLLRASVKLDDLETTQLTGSFDAAAAILVLEHIEWRKGVVALAGLRPEWIFLVIQRNETTPAVVPMQRDLAPSIRAFGEVARPTLVAETDLTTALAECGYALDQRHERPVPDQKAMIGLAFRSGKARAG
jgi:hypothetical protein